MDSISAFIDNRSDSNTEWTAQVVNPTGPTQIQKMAKDLYNGLNIEITNNDVTGLADDLFLVLRDGRVIASSPMSVLRETLLLVNADRYKTGTQLVGEIDVPDVILELSDTVFTLQGFPKSNTEKVVLTLIARYVEQQALVNQSGTLRTSFQKLSRLNDEQGTRRFYEHLGQTTGLETHVYGVPDWDVPADLGLISHEVTNDEIRKCWFVVHQGKTGQNIAMLAVNVEPYTWKGYWTFDTNDIEALDQYISQTY